jgi:hypothetical protein
MEPLEPAGKSAVTMALERDGASDEQGGGDEDHYERSLGHGRGFESSRVVDDESVSTSR